MSDLIILARQTEIPPHACTESPPTPTESNPRPTDDCFVNIAFNDTTQGNQPVRRVRFDRVGTQFVLSPSNNEEIQTWYQDHDNTPSIERTLRVAGYLGRSPHLSQGEQHFPLFLVISHYIATGETRMPNRDHATGEAMDLANAVMDIIADSSSREAVGSILGQLQLMRQESWISQDTEITGRIQWINNIIDLIPSYRTFRLRFLDERDITQWNSLSGDRQELVQDILSFSREVVLSHSLGRPLRYGPYVQRAFDAYNQIHGSAQEEGTRTNFCVALGEAIDVLANRPEAGNSFIQDCGVAVRVREEASDQQALASVRADLETFLGSGTLMAGVARESSEAHMEREFFFPDDREARASVRSLFNNFFSHLSIRISGGQPQVRFDFDSFRTQLEISLRDEAGTRLEYLILGLALLRRYFPGSSPTRPIRALHEGRFQEISWDMEPSQLESIRNYSQSLELRLGGSQRVTDDVLPWVEGGLLVAGIAGLVLSFAVPEIRDDEILFNTIGSVSSGVSGFGLFSFGTHFLEEPLDIQNHYAWDLGMGAAGLAVGVATFLLISLLGGASNNSGNDMRFPVDPYGP